MTVLGKLLVFVTTLFALAALSLAFWSYAEERDLEGKAKALGAQIAAEKRQNDAVFVELRKLVEEYARGDRPMPYDPGDPYGARAQKMKVKDMKREIEGSRKDNQGRAIVEKDPSGNVIEGLEQHVADQAQQWQRDSAQLTQMTRRLSSLRAEVMALLEEHKQLRETVANAPAGPPLRDITRGAWSDMASQDNQVAQDRPRLMAQIMQLMSLQQRYEELKKRVEQLKKPVSADEIPVAK
jgi:hypothetical protein